MRQKLLIVLFILFCTTNFYQLPGQNNIDAKNVEEKKEDSSIIILDGDLGYDSSTRSLHPIIAMQNSDKLEIVF